MNSMRCPNCGLVNWATAETCKRCGIAFHPNPGAAEGAPEQQQEYYDDYQGAPADGWTHYEGYQQGGYQGGYQGGGGYAGYGGGYGNGYGYASAMPASKSQGLAIASLVVSLLTGCAPIGLILGIVALRRAKRYPEQYGGEGFAIAGIIFSVISFFTLGIVMAIAIPNLLASRRAANEAGAINVLRTLHAAEATFQATTGAGEYGTLPELVTAQLIDQKLAGGVYYGYRFEIKTTGTSFEATATPSADGDKSGRSFYISEDGIVRGARKNGAQATGLDPPVGQDNFGERRAYRPSTSREYSPAY